jgi:fucose permease
VFPTLVSLTPERLGPERAAHAIGHQLAAAGVGAAALPGAIALAIGAGGLGALGPSLVALATTLVLIHAATGRAVAGAPPIALIRDGGA